MTYLVGAEHDRKALGRLKKALRRAGARRLRQRWAIFGSQELNDAEFEVAGGRLTVEIETYMGIRLTGDEQAIDAVRQYL